MATTLLLRVQPRQPARSTTPDGELSGDRSARSTLGLRTLAPASGACACLAVTLVVLLLFEGFADVIVVVFALELLHLDEGSVGFLNASWGSARCSAAPAWRCCSTAAGWWSAIAGRQPRPRPRDDAARASGPSRSPPTSAGSAIGIGFIFVEVAAKTLMQRLGSDETMGRVVSALESARLAAMALGSIGAAAIISLLGTRAAR